MENSTSEPKACSLAQNSSSPRNFWPFAIVVVLLLATVGVTSLPPMIGDEVTHFYLLKSQAESWPTPTFQAEIPVGWDPEGGELRGYPHPHLWHYTLAIPFTIFGQSAVVVQVLHALFVLQGMVAICALIGRGADSSDNRRWRWLTLVVFVSLPMTLFFSITFYQDVPAAAQILTSFAFLRRKRIVAAAVFLAVAFCVKVSMLLFLPGFALAFIFIAWRDVRSLLIGSAASLAIVFLAATLSWAALNSQGHEYYPLENLKLIYKRYFPESEEVVSASTSGNASSSKKPADKRIAKPADRSSDTSAVKQTERLSDKPVDKPTERPVSLYAANVIAHHPGDLRQPINWIMYGGGVLAGLLLTPLFMFPALRDPRDAIENDAEIKKTIVFCIMGALPSLVLTYSLLRTSPDARFFYAPLVLLFPVLTRPLVRFRFRKVWLPLFLIAALLQVVGVLYKTHSLRHIPAGLQETISAVESHLPMGGTVFMYPEGSYRLFTVKHDWYLGYELRDLWRGDNDSRIKLFEKYGINAVVVKHHLVGEIDEDMHNLGVYPQFFVDQLKEDSRFPVLFQNDYATVFGVPE